MQPFQKQKHIRSENVASAYSRQNLLRNLPFVRKDRTLHTKWSVWATASKLQQVSAKDLKGPRSIIEDQAWFFTEPGQKGWVEAMELDTISPDMPSLLIELGINYDPDRLASALSTQWPKVYGRALRVSALLGTFIAQITRDVALGEVEQHMALRAKQLRTLLSKLGPSFVKIGQALSARPDLLPRDYLETLADLQDRLPPFPTEIAYAVMEEELGGPLSQFFEYVSAEPVAAASLGQVYRARLLTGEEVAIKVQRPGIGEIIAVDMLLLRRLMGVVDAKLTQISQPLVPLVDEFARRLFAELDYVAEGHNCERFAELYGAMPKVKTPKIYWGTTRRRVLTMEWIEGVKLTDRMAMDNAGLNIVDFVDIGVECTLRQLLEHGFFHADPHPGNLLATREGNLVYLDFGMMSEAPQYARYAIISHVVNLVNRDYEAMCRDYYTLQFMDPSVDTSPIAPALAAFFDDVLESSVSELNFKAIVDGLGDVLFQFPFRVPPYYALILRSLTVLEGLALTADSNYKLLARAYPYMARRLLTDPAPELRSSFEGLVIRDGKLRMSRLVNLIRESGRSMGGDMSGAGWAMADWLVSPNAEHVRSTLVTEVSRLLDAIVVEDARRRIRERFGNADLADRVLPITATEQEDRENAELVADALKSRAYFDNIPLRGSGPFGLLTPADVDRLSQQVQDMVTNTWPKLRTILAQPGAQDLIRSMSSALAKRFVARSVKALLSPMAGQALVPRRT